MVIKAYKYKDEIGISLGNKNKIPVIIQIKVKELIRDKLNIIFASSFEKWLKDYEYLEKQGNWYLYVDTSGLNDSNEIKIKFKNQKIEVIEKVSTGTVRTNYTLKKEKWSKGKWIITKVEKFIYEGTQTVKLESEIIYSKVTSKHWLPTKIITKTKQNLLKIKTGEIDRELSETFEFNEHSIESSTARDWFENSKTD